MGPTVIAAQAQEAPAAPPSAVELQQRIDTISAALAATQQQIEQSQRQMQHLQQELDELKQQMATATPAANPPTSEPAEAGIAEPAKVPIEERQQTTEAQVKVLDQVKVESASKYPVRITGLILFNGFLNRGVPDNVDLPAVAVRPSATSGNGSLGASFRQTILGVEGDGPRVLGARTSANVNLDFFDGLAYTSYGTSDGVVRMRTAAIDFDWKNDALEAGIVAPLISPRSPTSFATVAEPSLAGAGNLWTWAPQLRYTHRFPVGEADRLQIEFGLWDASSAGYNPNQLFRAASPGELTQQPAYESRVSYGAREGNGAEIGVGGYYNRETYPGYAGTNYTEHLDSWASTIDWRIPFAHYFELSGEGYRGRAIGGLGGGVYKDAVSGTSPVSGTSVLHGLNAIGGWTQWKTRFSEELETDLAIGLDDGFARDFHAVVQPANSSSTQLRARNRALVANLIYRPKTYIIFSPEYRRIWSWPINSSASTLNVFTLSVGFQF
ncbi:MAG TPA: hypothetical protein VN612_13075 [Acidobacteriaceae bacterium]|nr:hypothetical protein [Acidobacteriaceae bacterium]